MSDFLRPHGLWHPSLSCPSPSPRVCTNSCPLSRWCHSAISSSLPFSFCFQSFPTLRCFPINWLFRWLKYWNFIVSPSNEYSGLISFRIDWFDLPAVQGTLKSHLQYQNLKASIFWLSAFFVVQLSHRYLTTGKTIALTIWIFVGKVMSLLFNTLSMFVIAFLPRRKCLSWLQSPSTVILESKKIKSATVFTLGLDAMILVFWMLRALSQLFHSPFSPLSRGSLFPVCFPPLKWVSSVYLRLLILLPAVLILACYLSSPAFCMMYSACKLNKQVDNIQPWHTSFPILNQSVVQCLVLIVDSWPAHRFLRRQVRWSGIPISKNFPQFVVIHRVKGFSAVNEAEVDVFQEFSFFFCDPVMLETWSLVPLPFLNPAWISGSSRFTYCWSLAWRILNITC